MRLLNRSVDFIGSKVDNLGECMLSKKQARVQGGGSVGRTPLLSVRKNGLGEEKQRREKRREKVEGEKK